jgi:hypothetical protein
MQPCDAGVLPYPEEPTDAATLFAQLDREPAADEPADAATLFAQPQREPEPEPAADEPADAATLFAQPQREPEPEPAADEPADAATLFAQPEREPSAEGHADAAILFSPLEHEPYSESPAEQHADAATIVFPRLEHEPDLDPSVEEPAEAATMVFPRVEHEPEPDPSAETALAGASGSTVIGKKVAVGAMVAGGLVAGQIGWTTGFFDQGNSAEHRSMLAASSTSSSVLPVPSEPDAGTDRRDIEKLHRGADLAMQAAFAHAATVHAVSVNTALTKAAARREAMVMRGGGNLDDWISVALQKLRLDQGWAPAVKRIILEESGGDPRAVNRWDSNAVAGRPSQGLMQLVPETFLRYVLPELARRPITDPAANITAGIRYMLANYGYLTLGQGGRHDASGGYVGY